MRVSAFQFRRQAFRGVFRSHSSRAVVRCLLREQSEQHFARLLQIHLHGHALHANNTGDRK